MRSLILSLGVVVVLGGCGSSNSGSGNGTPRARPTLRSIITPAPPSGTVVPPPPLPTRTPIPPADYTATLKGSVTDSRTGSPLAGALISVNNGAKTATTTAFGEYTVAFPAGAAAPVTVTIRGFSEGLAMGMLKRCQTARVNFKLVKILPGSPVVPPPPQSFGVP